MRKQVWPILLSVNMKGPKEPIFSIYRTVSVTISSGIYSDVLVMYTAWRERNAEKRIEIAHNALQQDVKCVILNNFNY